MVDKVPQIQFPVLYPCMPFPFPYSTHVLQRLLSNEVVLNVYKSHSPSIPEEVNLRILELPTADQLKDAVLQARTPVDTSHVPKARIPHGTVSGEIRNLSFLLGCQNYLDTGEMRNSTKKESRIQSSAQIYPCRE